MIKSSISDIFCQFFCCLSRTSDFFIFLPTLSFLQMVPAFYCDCFIFLSSKPTATLLYHMWISSWPPFHHTQISCVLSGGRKISVFWYVMPCNLIDKPWCCRRNCCACHLSWWRRHQIPLKHQYTCTILHGIVSGDSNIFFIFLYTPSSESTIILKPKAFLCPVHGT
jgi:hypothetical protein